MEDGKITLTVRSDTFVPVVNIQLNDDTVKMSDNYFQLLPGIEKKLKFIVRMKFLFLKL